MHTANTNKLALGICLSVIVSMTLVGKANAQFFEQFSPVAVTGFNIDAIYGSGPSGADGVNADLQAEPLNADGTSPGFDYDGTQLSPGGTLESASSPTVFQFQPYGQNNVLSVGATSGTLTLAAPGPYSEIGLLLNNLLYQAPEPSTFVFNFSDGTSTSFTTPQTIPYWTDSAVSFSTPTMAGGLAGSFNALVLNGANTGPGINMEDYDFFLDAADSQKTLESITVVGDANNRIDIYAVSGAAVPEPSTYAMIIAGLGLLAFGLRLSRNRAASKI